MAILLALAFVWLTVPPQAVAGTAPGSDFNGDGKADLLWRHTSGTVAVWLLDGTQPPTPGSLGAAPTDWTIQ